MSGSWKLFPLLVGVAAGVASVLATSRAHAADPDPWVGPDKALHFSISAVLAGGGYGVSALFLEQPWQRAIAGAGFSLTLGAGKELYDLSGHGDPSWKDFTWDVAGTAVGVGIALLVDAAIASGNRQHPTATSRTSRMAFTF